MSQAGLVDIESANPQIPTSFDTNDGTAIPIFNVLEILGVTVGPHSVPVQTTGSGNTVNVEVQLSTDLASPDVLQVGLANFDSSFFTVDASGFVSLSGSSTTEIQVDANTPPGTSPVVPLAGVITFTGAQVAAGVVGANVLRTDSVAAHTVTYEIQRSAAVASTTLASNGVSHFDSAAFDVDANGFVQLNGGGIATTAFDIQANTAPGTDPVVPTSAGVVTVNGAAVANHSVVLETRSRAANAYNLEIQYATSAAATDATKSGVAHFDSTQFSVDANGFVSLTGGGLAIDSIGTQTGTNPIAPTGAGLVTINGAVVAAGTHPIRSNGTGANTMAIEVQISQAIASTDATKIGLCNFNSGQFSVDANGFVSLVGGSLAMDSFQPDSGINPVVPDATGLVVMAGSGSITTVGSLNTLTTQLTGLTNHAVLVGAGTATITKIAATANTGAILQNNSGADPSYSTATYPSTTTVSQLLYSSSANVVAGLATANRAVITTNASGVPVATALATDGQLIIGSTAGAPAAATLTQGTGITITNGSNSISIATTAALSAFNSVVIQQFTSNGTYTPTTGMKYCIIETIGSGAGGGGVAVTTGGIAVGGGGGAGGYAQIVSTAATIGVSQTVTVGVAGLAGSSAGGVGGSGNTTSVGTICVSAGGTGGGGNNIVPAGGAGGAGTTGTVLVTGNAGGCGFSVNVSGWVLCYGGQGAGGIFGGAPIARTGGAGVGIAGISGAGYGSGGGGAVGVNNASGFAGGAGSAGYVRITEFIST